MTATHKLNDLKDFLLQIYPDAKFQYINNPRAEKAGNSLVAKNDKFKDLGHNGIHINPDDIKALVEVCRANKDKFEEKK